MLFLRRGGGGLLLGRRINSSSSTATKRYSSLPSTIRAAAAPARPCPPLLRPHIPPPSPPPSLPSRHHAITITRRSYRRGPSPSSSRGSQQQRGGLSPEQLQLVMRISGRVLGSGIHFIRSRGLHKSRPLLIAGLLFIPTAIGGVFLVSHLEEAPLTGRTQLVFLSPQEEMQLGAMAAAEVFKEEKNFILPHNSPESLMVHDVAVELIKGLLSTTTAVAAHTRSRKEEEEMEQLKARINQMDWQVTVIDSDVVNAFVVPSGGIFVYTALLDQVKTRGALAFILGHEISHAIARHSVEKMGVLCLGAFFVDFVAGLLGPSTHRRLQYILLPYLQSLVIDMPYSRSLESEADALGLRLMAEAGYDPREGVEAWKRMEKGDGTTSTKGTAGGGKAQPQQQSQQPWEFVSTHPSHATRIEQLNALLPQALALQKQALDKKRVKGEQVPDGQEALPSSQYRGRTGGWLSSGPGARAQRRAGSAQVALRASSLVVPLPGLEEE